MLMQYNNPVMNYKFWEDLMMPAILQYFLYMVSLGKNYIN